MPPTQATASTNDTQSSTQSQRRALARRSTRPDAEEERLLGYHRNNDPEAVPIEWPATRQLNHAMNYKVPSTSLVLASAQADSIKPYSGGPKPRNTLKTSPNLPTSQANFNQLSKPKLGGGSQQILNVEVSKGSNVRSMPHATSTDSTFSAAPPAKRQKTMHTRSSSPITIDDYDPIDDVPVDQVNFGGSHSGGRAPSSQSKRSLVSNARTGPTLALKEYSKVERLMDSGPRGKRRIKNARRSTSASSSPLLDPSSRLNPIEIPGDDELGDAVSMPTLQSSTVWRGTMRIDATGARKNQRKLSHQLRTEETKSMYFDGPTAAKTSSTSERMRSAFSSGRSNAPQGGDDNLRSKFIPLNGKPRGADLSSDELELPTTVGEHADYPLSPVKRSAQISSKSSSSTVKSSIHSDGADGLEPSNIKAKFPAKAPNKSAAPRSHITVSRHEEALPPWSIPLRGFSLRGSAEMAEDEGLGLVYNEEGKIYSIHRNGKIVSTRTSSLQIQPKKIQKVLWELSGGKIRIESSRSENEDNILDVELCNEKDVSSLLKKLQTSTSFSIMGKDSELMGKMFEKRRTEPSTLYAAASNPLRALPNDLQLATINKQRREIRQLESSETNNNRGPRTKLVNGLLNQVRSEQDSDVSHNKPKNSALTNGLPENRSAGLNEEPSGIIKVLEQLQPAHNNHLRRSTRTSGGTEKAFKRPSAFQDVSDPKNKYSIMHGLGLPWKKPLSYPKVGKKKATVEWKDLERLDDGEYLNDNLIGFYLRYLEHKLEKEKPELAKRVYFFNTFFYQRLTTPPKSERGINYEAVQKWTRGVDLFTYDYVVVPINELTHWYLVIICNLPALDRNLAALDDVVSPLSETHGRDAGFLSQTNHKEIVPLSPDTEEPVEQETADSFAEMSLENNVRQPGTRETSSVDPDPVGSKDEDEEMLDVLAESLKSPSSIHASVATKDAEKIVEVADPIEDPVEATKSSPISRTQKRKSVPPAVMKIDPSQPAIIAFDSLDQSHGCAIKSLKNYLFEEGKAKRGGMELDLGQLKGINAKNIPHQDNYSDCGLYMLGYVEKFLEENPKDFIAKIIRREYDERKDWSKLVPSALRTSMREQLQNLYKDDREERRDEAIKAGKHHPRRSPPPTAAASTSDYREREGHAKSSRNSLADSNNEQWFKTRRSAPQVALPDDKMDKEKATRELSKVPEADANSTGQPSTRGLESEASACTQDEPSLILIESQSQSMAPASNVAGASTQIAPSGNIELPSEIQDSQPSKNSVEVPHLPKDTPSPPALQQEAVQQEQSLSPSLVREAQRSPPTTRARKSVKKAPSVINLDD